MQCHFLGCLPMVGPTPTSAARKTFDRLKKILENEKENL
jgi:hypothetical protein